MKSLSIVISSLSIILRKRSNYIVICRKLPALPTLSAPIENWGWSGLSGLSELKTIIDNIYTLNHCLRKCEQQLLQKLKHVIHLYT